VIILEVSTITENLFKYLEECVKLSKDELKAITFALHLIKEIMPMDGPQVFARQQTLITASEDLSWVITVINRKKSQINIQIKDLKAMDFTMLTRNGRPSAMAIDYEIYITHSDLKKLETDLSILENTYEYLTHIETSIDRLIWLLRDKLKYNN